MPNHFVSGEFPFHKTEKKLPDDIYGRALDRFVISALDVLVVRQSGEILLGKRSWEPAKDVFWIIGGARNRGEYFEETASRHVKRELGIPIDPNRFRMLGCYSLAFAKRRQHPEEHGVHTDSHVFVTNLTDSEVAAIQLNEEYQESKWIMPKEVVKQSDTFHPAVVQICKDYLAMGPPDY